MKILSGRGPGIKIRISTVGSVDVELKSEFKAQGINQTIHRIYLDMKCNVNVLTPFKDINRDVENKVLFAENIIVGQIPESYYNLEGIDSSNAIEIVE